MASKTKKSKSKSPTDNTKLLEAEKKIERLELLSQAQDLEHITTQIGALKVKMQALQTEANMVNKETAELQKDGKTKADTFTVELATFRNKYNVPAGKEVNLRTGELVDPPPSQQGGQGPQGGPPSKAPVNPDSEVPQS